VAILLWLLGGVDDEGFKDGGDLRHGSNAGTSSVKG